MDRFRDIAPFIIVDAMMLTLSWYGFYWVREPAATPPELFVPAVVVALFWLVMVALSGMYHKTYLVSRFDELLRIGKTVTIGTLVLFFLLFIDSMGWNERNLDQAKEVTFIYWAMVYGCLALGRMGVLTWQIHQIKRGHGLHKALIVGTGPTSHHIKEDLDRHKLSGMQVVGFLSVHDGEQGQVEGLPILGHVRAIRPLIREHDIRDVIIALEPESRDDLVRILDLIDLPDVSVKILPDFHQMISGLNRTNQIYGLPLIEVMPDPMPTWERFMKRAMDVVISAVVLVLASPVFVLVAVAVRLSSSGPALFRQARVGLHGREFTIFKFRTMYEDAEKRTGPVFAQKNDPRLTPIGGLMRKLRLDELPQFWNVLRGDMSLVGPRPERAYFVEQFKEKIPLYTRRLRVKPGITGWAQVKWKYDESFEDVVEKTKYDLFYVENISLRMDLKILFNTIITVVTGKGQ